MKIVILDGYTENPGDLSWEGFESLGALKVYDRTPVELVQERIGEAQIVLTNKTPITEETMKGCPNLKYIGVLATGYNVVEVAKARERGITVTNIPSYGTEAVSQFVFALLLEICHHVGHHSQEVFKGRWQSSADWCFWDYPLVELSGKTMGIIGYGRIGKTTAKIAQAFGMKVLVHTRTPEKSMENESLKFTDLDELYAKSHVIVLHCPLTPETEHMINRDSIRKMRDGVILINNSRGALMVEEDLYEALESGKIFGAGVDVASEEPIKEDNPLLKARNLFITPHISWAPKETRARLMEIAVLNLRSYLEGNPMNMVS